MNIISETVLDRLLLAKFLLKHRSTEPAAKADSHYIATQILLAHDAAELGAAAIADHLGLKLDKGNRYLWDYVDAISKHLNVSAGFFRQLNQARIDVKHYGIHPSPEQFKKVVENTYQRLSELCVKAFGKTLDETDESALILDDNVRNLFLEARSLSVSGRFKEALDALARALHRTFKSNPALAVLNVGDPNTKDAIRLSGFGVKLNDYLALQHFLPRMSWERNNFKTYWKPSKFHHPINWNAFNVNFCIRAFLDLVLRIQNAERVPWAMERDIFFEHVLTVKKNGIALYAGVTVPVEVMKGEYIRQWKIRPAGVLNEGDTLTGRVSIKDRSEFVEVPIEEKSLIEIFNIDSLPTKFIAGSELKNVEIICVPNRQALAIFPNVTPFPWEPDEF
jgi:hypothetical protein